MNLNFMQEFADGTYTKFVYKIINGLYLNNLISINRAACLEEQYETLFSKHGMVSVETPKLHTIRADKNNRWKAGNKIHFQVWTGKPYNSKVYQFAPVIECKSVQEIEIKHFSCSIELEIGSTTYIVKRNHKAAIYEYDQVIEQLAKNDGFDSVQEFFNYFNKDFTGKIIHWTDLKY